MESQEKQFIELLRRGDESAYKCVYDRYYVLLCKIAREFTGDPFQAECIVGDTIFHLWEIRGSLDISVALFPYLVRAVRNRCINHLRAEQNKRETESLDIRYADLLLNKYIIVADSPLGRLLERELAQRIQEAIEILPDETKRVFCKSRFEEMKQEQIALELGISVNTVKYHIKKALAHLREELSGYLLLFLLILS